MLKLISPDSSINGLQLDPTRTRSRRRAPHARSGRRHTSYRAVELTAHGALELHLQVSDGMVLVVRRSTTSDTHSLVRARSTRSSWTEMDGVMLLIVPSS